MKLIKDHVFSLYEEYCMLKVNSDLYDFLLSDVLMRRINRNSVYKVIIPELWQQAVQGSEMINKPIHNNHININIMAIPMQGVNYSGIGVKPLSNPWDRFNLKREFSS